jgi:hypothetical protein
MGSKCSGDPGKTRVAGTTFAPNSHVARSLGAKTEKPTAVMPIAPLSTTTATNKKEKRRRGMETMGV